MAAEAGLGAAFHVDSAGTDSCHEGEKPDVRSIKIAKRHGIALDSIRARRLAEKDFSDINRIFAMDGGHFFEIKRRAPHGCRARIEMFMDDGADVPDPWYGTENDFESVYTLIEGGAAALLKRLKDEYRL
jgi:protein-tyrosine phosphatase